MAVNTPGTSANRCAFELSSNDDIHNDGTDDELYNLKSVMM